MNILRRGSKGEAVEVLQKRLVEAGYKLPITGNFGDVTESSVRGFQMRNGLRADGVVGADTHNALARRTGNTDLFAILTVPSPTTIWLNSLLKFNPSQQAATPRRLAMPACQLRMSARGLAFLQTLECNQSSLAFHWPGGASGVTLGAGYDMKLRSADTIKRDMLAIGKSNADAELASKAAGLMGTDAIKFCRENGKSKFNIENKQETILLKNAIVSYENTVRSNIKVALLQEEFDALVSFAYNPGGRWRSVSLDINKHKIVDAMSSIKLAVKSDGKTMQGLVNRRTKEVKLFTTCDYGKLNYSWS